MLYLNERWRHVGGGYMISNYGRWYSGNTEKILKEDLNNSGYYRVRLVIDGKVKRLYTHLTVVIYFGDKNGNKLKFNNETEAAESIDHLNRSKADNRQCNLEIVSHQENCRRKKDIDKIDVDMELFN